MHTLDLLTYIVMIYIILKIVKYILRNTKEYRITVGAISVAVYTLFHAIYFCAKDNNVIDIIQSITL